MSHTALPCPFCGSNIDPSNPDVMHVSGSWHETEDGRAYSNAHDEKRQGFVYTLNCPTIYGGCGAQTYGDTVDEVLKNWNKRANQPDEQLLKFYGVSTYPELVKAMEHHIEKLQKRVELESARPSFPRKA